jgi:hypothetical protein
MGVAALIFSSVFATVPDPPRALAFNLMGSVVGGLLEYCSNHIGIKNLVLIAAGLYMLSWLMRSTRKSTSSLS